MSGLLSTYIRYFFECLFSDNSQDWQIFKLDVLCNSLICLFLCRRCQLLFFIITVLIYPTLLYLPQSTTFLRPQFTMASQYPFYFQLSTISSKFKMTSLTSKFIFIRYWQMSFDLVSCFPLLSGCTHAT